MKNVLSCLIILFIYMLPAYQYCLLQLPFKFYHLCYLRNYPSSVQKTTKAKATARKMKLDAKNR